MQPTGSFEDRGHGGGGGEGDGGGGAGGDLRLHRQHLRFGRPPTAAHAGLAAYVLVPNGRIAAGKMAQAVMHSPDPGRGRQLRRRVARGARAAERHPIALVNSVNPDRIAGQKTAALRDRG
ncbi:MAG: hypothetical protein U0531_11635 [Dehalococcoidia bacterium]